mmetsp:Transcript_1304/g.2134  ORF Transcript_1304/g.2134 Transcript_1304/m.2134 type:complete len:794 (-) Transcript_1304:76-2457(-)|eukprot:CAMPEP_0119031244 /NCGR_PEP_ID=MMETSP1176-20130426/41444_1 /TAXON_ID=265551 /ORGANISM="Synedropsis recta cf, Strain CCMP1620" /LENGTH=793 /DNA_ID=CAMNT_0006987635 /DNA_START=131 /DNA_END=2512 /DNA_ORIENTATION=+
MSRWLSSVNNLLEKLDGTVEDAIEDQRDEDVDNLDSILAKRGLSEQLEEEEEVLMAVQQEEFQQQEVIPEDGEMEEQQQGEESLDHSHGVVVDEKGEEEEVASDFSVVEAVEKEESSPSSSIVVVENEPTEQGSDDSKEEDKREEDDDKPEPANVEDTDAADDAADDSENKEDADATIDTPTADVEESSPTTEQKEGDENVETIKAVVEDIISPPSSSSSNHNKPVSRSIPPQNVVPTPTSSVSDKALKLAQSHAREAQKESRTLRRHVVSLNKQLESAESELEAQRSELGQAGEKLDKDRKKYKEEKEKLVAKQTEDVKTSKKQTEQTVADLKTEHDAVIQQMQQRIQVAEEKRMQEGGDWTKELQNTVDRERELIRKVALIEDEKITLLSQITTLQSQEERLQSRLDSISNTADSAYMREREAEDKLDMALSMHARQLAQRQAREADLERTIADLSANLANNSSALGGDAEGDSAAGAGNTMKLKSQVFSLEEDFATAKAQLESEKQRVMIMQHELRDMSKERTLEVSSARSKQHQFDRKIADMSLQISKLQSNLREAQKGSSYSSSDMMSGGADSSTVQELTEQLVRQQEKMGQTTSELSALKIRLQVATSRAQKAEEALSQTGPFDAESSPESGNYGGGSSTMVRRRRRGGQEIGSIRQAINLNAPRDENTERIGKAIDAVDKFSQDTGKYLRSNPLARGGFIVYLLVLHLWTFVVLFLHTHKFETVHGDFGAANHLAHGPHALMQQHDPEIFKQVIADKIAAKQEVAADIPVEKDAVMKSGDGEVIET